MVKSAVDHGLVTTFGRLVEAYSALERQLGEALERECGIPHTWFEAMLRIARSPDKLTMSALASQIALTTGGMTRLLDRMVTAGLVERVPCPTDRRVSFAALTPDGRQKLEEAAKIHVRNLERVFADYTSDEIKTLDDLLDRLLRRDRERPAHEAAPCPTPGDAAAPAG
ncbi:MarR family transcriptional regulator [Micromonospora sp. NPDC047465]|uniref:MarR family winged helix-turn-helix transcriptional regulator n=1 Tax=Micromonospora sp. NPDC047465 TaxID=3154813 RepID=UPI0033D25B1B